MRLNRAEENAPITEKQLRKIRRLTKLDVSGVYISVRQFNSLIDNSKAGLNIIDQVISYGGKWPK